MYNNDNQLKTNTLLDKIGTYVDKQCNKYSDAWLMVIGAIVGLWVVGAFIALVTTR